MRGKNRLPFKILAFFVIAFMWAAMALPSKGQELLPQIFITGNDVTSPPSAILHVYGRDAEGNAIDFTSEPLVLTNEGTQIAAEVSGTYPAGTLTVFLIDLPHGIEEQLPAIQQAVQQYSGAGGGMQEQVDAVAIYQVGADGPRQLLAPTTFNNEIQNFFVEDMTPETEATALRDSLGLLLDELDPLKPRPEMVTSVVVISDGTDVVSTEFDDQEIITRANELNVPIHSIWVSGSGLTIDQQEQGKTYLEETAAATRGFSALLDDSATIGQLWNRIASFRDHARVRFQMDELGGGTYEVVLSLASEPTVSDSITVEVPENQPQVSLNIPEGGDEITLQAPNQPVLLRLGATVTWLDGLDRELREARLRVNGLDVVDVPIDQLDDFTVEVSNLDFGSNDVELFVMDEQGLQASNLPAKITVVEGDQQVIPEDLQPQRELGSTVLNIFLFLVVLGVLVGLFFWLRRMGLFERLFPKGRSQSAKQGVTYSTKDDPNGLAVSTAGDLQGGPPFEAHIEIVESVSDMPQSLELLGAMIRLGRSPSMSDIAFRDDLTVSRQHAVLMLEGNHFRLFDENSTSGTWVNGRQVPDYGIELADGDEIHIGAVHLVYHQPF
jgi:FHA domain